MSFFESVRLAVLEPLLADLVATDVEVQDGLGHAAEADGAWRGGLALLCGSGVEPNGVARPADAFDLGVLWTGVAGTVKHRVVIVEDVFWPQPVWHAMWLCLLEV